MAGPDRPAATDLILRDEAIESLLDRLDDYSVATLHVAVDHGEYQAWLEGPEVVYIEGDRGPILTDVLVSLERSFHG